MSVGVVKGTWPKVTKPLVNTMVLGGVFAFVGIGEPGSTIVMVPPAGGAGGFVGAGGLQLELNETAQGFEPPEPVPTVIVPVGIGTERMLTTTGMADPTFTVPT